MLSRLVNFTFKMKNISYIYFSFYIEMKGREDQPEGVPDTVHLLVRHKIPPSSEMEKVCCQ